MSLGLANEHVDTRESAREIFPFEKARESVKQQSWQSWEAAVCKVQLHYVEREGTNMYSGAKLFLSIL